MKSWRHQPLTVRLLAGTAGVMTAAAAFAAPAQATPADDAFLAALNNAGINYDDPLDEEALGQSVCPILAQPDGTFNKAASSVVAKQAGMSPEMAGTFTSIAISMYCPSFISNVASGQLPEPLQQIPGVSSIPGLAGIPGVPGF